MKKYTVLIMLLLFFGVAKAQLTKNNIVLYLTNGNSRTWLFKNYSVTLGNSCSGDGQSFEFNKDGTLGWKKCVNGKPVYKEIKWSVAAVPGNAGEYNINFNPSVQIEEESNPVKVMRINLPLPVVNTKNTKMTWNDPPAVKAAEDRVFEFLSKN